MLPLRIVSSSTSRFQSRAPSWVTREGGAPTRGQDARANAGAGLLCPPRVDVDVNCNQFCIAWRSGRVVEWNRDSRVPSDHTPASVVGTAAPRLRCGDVRTTARRLLSDRRRKPRVALTVARPARRARRLATAQMRARPLSSGSDVEVSRHCWFIRRAPALGGCHDAPTSVDGARAGSNPRASTTPDIVIQRRALGPGAVEAPASVCDRGEPRAGWFVVEADRHQRRLLDDP